MPDLIPIMQCTIGTDTIPTVNARDLHAYLGLARDYTTWIKAQIRLANLVENMDFVVFTQKGENLTGGRPITEYHLTFDAAKHVAMMSRLAPTPEWADPLIPHRRRLADVRSADSPLTD